MEVTRSQFVALIEDLIAQTMERMSEVIKDAELSVKDIDEVLLVGGSTRIPLVRDTISALLGIVPVPMSIRMKL